MKNLSVDISSNTFQNTFEFEKPICEADVLTRLTIEGFSKAVIEGNQFLRIDFN